jgi:integrase
MYDINDVLVKINNEGYKVKLNYRFRDGKHIIYLNYRKTKNHVTRHETKRIAILTGTDKKEDLLRIKKADLYRQEFENLLKREQDIFHKAGEKTFLTDYCDYISSTYKNKSSAKIFRLVKQHLIKYSGNSVTLADVNKSFCMRFVDYLKNADLKADHFYFDKFKQVLYRAISEELISDMPFLRRMSIKKNTPKIEFLTKEELLKVYHCETKYIDCKNAFIFACYTGLRFIDLFKLKFSDIKDGILYITQQKTDEVLKIKVHETAMNILNLQKIKQGDNDLVFDIKCYNRWQEYIPRIMKSAGIEKNISGHCARHTFATLCVTEGIDIYVISKLLGHKSVKHTQRYANLVDATRDEAIEKLPKI